MGGLQDRDNESEGPPLGMDWFPRAGCSDKVRSVLTGEVNSQELFMLSELIQGSKAVKIYLCTMFNNKECITINN